MSDVILEYKRVKTDLSTGRVFFCEEKDEQDLRLFEELEFQSMLQIFADYLRRYPDARAVWQRVDRPGLVAYVLDDRTTQLFREDPVAAISAMCPSIRSPSTVVRRMREERTPRVTVSVRVGYETLADAFGEEVFAKSRMRGNDIPYVECPCCGIWTPMHLLGDGPHIGGSHCMNARCRAFDKPLSFRTQNEHWTAYRVLDLLATESPRFYLPRAWNDGRPWVSWEELNRKYYEFVKEKEAWSPIPSPA